MIRLLRRTLRLGMLGGIGYGVWRRLWGRQAADTWADSWVSTGQAGATPSAAAPMPPAPAPGTVTAAPVHPATTEVPGTNGEAVHPPARPSGDTPGPPGNSGDTPPPPGSDESADGNGRVSAGGAGSEMSGPSRPVTARPNKPSRTGPARRTPTGKVEEPPGQRLWVAANDGVCPQSHPVKAKLSSKIFHLPGARNYSRTHADRCYPDEESAVADGLRPALR
jgi:hypothetical protein